MGKCSRYLGINGTVRDIDAAFNAAYASVYNDFGGNGERVLGFAYREMELTMAAGLQEDPVYTEQMKARFVGADAATAIKGKQLSREECRCQLPDRCALLL